ncbi:unknown seed protein like 1 [Hibiscus trionum]|uniref:BURP domain-containing protein n=1 Tax=Hibiscus trionum TaxID=183268 RepID=A0A9W7IJU5_HIBTR|nr:unknown seed protein like 1 [Hibiscus trionum]
MISCHHQTYLYAVYICHFELASRNKVFIISLRGDNGEIVTPISVCHFDTSSWDADHVAFRSMGFKPGESEVCHLLPAHDLVVLPK